jgi:transposase
LGKSVPKVAGELGVATESLGRWIKRHEIDEGEREGLTADEREELRRLRRENGTLKQERDFLKKARWNQPVSATVEAGASAGVR